MISYRYSVFMPISISEFRYGRLFRHAMERLWIPAIRRLMAEKDWSQQDLADASGVRPNTITDTLHGTDSRIETFAALAKGLGVPLWALFCDAREYALFTDHVKQLDAREIDKIRQDEVRAAVQAELAPFMESLVAKISGQPIAPPDNPLTPSRPVLAVQPKTRKKKRTA